MKSRTEPRPEDYRTEEEYNEALWYYEDAEYWAEEEAREADCMRYHGL